MSKRICTAITIFIFSVTMFSEGIVFAATPTTPTNECKNFEKHLEQYESFEQMPAGLQNVYSECEGITVPKSNQTFNASDAQCEWVDELGRSRKEWHKDVKDGKLTNLYKRCYSTGNDGFEVDKYSLVNPHPGCKGIINAYEKQSSKKEINAKGLTKNYKNCTTYGTPYPQLVVPDPSLADLAANLQADGSIRINNDELFTESQTVTLTLASNAPPEKMQFSNNGQTWTNWEVFTGTKDWLITNNNAGQKTVYVRYKTGTTVSQADSDAIMLLAKYGATYSTANLSNSWAKSRTQLINVTLKNTGYLTWDSSDPQYPVQLTYRWLAPNGEIAEEYGNYAMFDQTIAYGEVVEVPLLVRAPKTAGNYVLEVDLEEWGVTDFSEMGVLPKKMPITITDEQLPERSTVSNVEALPFGIGSYTALENEPTPEVITACESTAILYEMSPDQTAFTVEYIVPYGRTINNVYDVWVDGDNTAFYEVDYNEYLNDSRRLFLYRDSAVESDMCSEEAEQFPNIRECENLYPDVAGVSNESCLDITKATASKWVSGYESGDFGPADLMIRAEFAKLIIGATEIPLLTHPEGVAIFSDIDPNGDEWYKDYAYTAFEAGLMSRDNDGRFSPMTQITFNDAVSVTLSAFDLSLNSCNYSVIYSGNETIGAGLFYGLIEYNKVPASPTLGKISREYAVHMLVNAYAQASHLSANPPLCPKSAGDIVPSADNIKQICGVEGPVKLSSTPSLTRNLGTLLNGVQVEVLDSDTLYARIQVIQTGATGYVSLGEIVPVCDVPTPPMPLVSPDDGGAVVASVVGIYAHIEPSVTTNYVDVNGDGNRDSADIIPYNVKLNVLEVKGNWLRVRFTGTDGRAKEGWVYSGFLVLGDGVVTEQRVPKTMATVDWAHQMTVDLRTNPSESATSIIWETYEDTRVQVIEKDTDSPFYFVKIELPSRDLSNELIEENYGRLYMGMADLSVLNGMAVGLSGWVHEEFMNEEGVNYPTPLAYPFDYDSETAVDNLVSQIFYEEVMGDIHGGIDYALEPNQSILAVAQGTVIEAQTDIRGEEYGQLVVVKHSDGKYSYYGHLYSLNVSEGNIVGSGDILGTSGDHLHFSIFKSSEDFELNTDNALNPTKYIGNYNSLDSNICMRELVVDLGMRDGDLIAEICDAGVGQQIGDLVGCGDFNDVGMAHSYCDAIEAAKEAGWIEGYASEPIFSGEREFRPSQHVTRAEGLKIVLEAAGINVPAHDGGNCFPDVNSDHWAEDYICHAKDQGWIQGHPSGYFEPNEEVQMTELSKIALNIFGFEDNKACWEQAGQDWYEPYINFLAYNGVEVKTPDTELSRAYSTYLIYSVFNLEADGYFGTCPEGEVSVHGPWRITEKGSMIIMSDMEEQSDHLITNISDDPSRFKFATNLLPAEPVITDNPDEVRDGNCDISRGEFYNYLELPGYYKEIGFPCLPEVYREFGGRAHSSLLFTNGAKFTYNGDEVWLRIDEIKNRMQAASYDGETADYGGIFLYDEVLGTFIWRSWDMTSYYIVGKNDKGHWNAWVEGDMRTKLDERSHSDDLNSYLETMCPRYGGSFCQLQRGTYMSTPEQRLVRYLGYPMDIERGAAPYDLGGTAPTTTGTYQQFVDGQMYSVDWRETYYVPGAMAESYSSVFGGSSGDHGFPVEDPIYDPEDELLKQKFENGYISLITKPDSEGNYVNFVFHEQSYERDETNATYFQGMKDQFFENEIYGVGINIASIAAGYGASKSKILSRALDAVMKKAAAKVVVKSGAKFIPFLGWGLAAYSGYKVATEAEEFHKLCVNYADNVPDDEDDRLDPSYYCGRRDAIVTLVGIGYGADKATSLASSIFKGLSKTARQGADKVQDVIGDVVDSGVADQMGKSFSNVLSDPSITKAMKNRAMDEFDLLTKDEYLKNILKDEKFLEKYVKGDFSKYRDNLKTLTGIDPPPTTHAHHMFSQSSALQTKFSNAEIDINNPLYLTWWEGSIHQVKSYDFNLDWENFFTKNANPSKLELLDQARLMSDKYDLDIHF